MIFIPRLLVCSVMAASIALAPSNFAQQDSSKSTESKTNNGPTVKAPTGAVMGQMQGDLRVFKGIPFALPPVGELRWKPPSPMPRWEGVKKATEYGAACWQPKPTLSTIYTRSPMPMSEDCLTLNIWAPIHATNAPVFFWIYGGALTGGASRDETYDGARLASRGTVVVSINYRLGALAGLRILNSAKNRRSEFQVIMARWIRSR